MVKILSIIIPTYNMEKYLRHCLDSLIVPNMDKVEVLVINDGSKDSSSDIGHEYQDKYPQTFRVIDKENGNYGSCVNRGLKEATGKYIKVLDADDTFETINFKEYINFLETKDADLVINDFAMVTPKNITTTIWTCKNIPQDGSIFKFAKLGDKCNMWMHAVAYKADIFKSIKGGYHQTEGISFTDQEWIFLPMSVVRTVVYFNKVLYKYLIGRNGQTIDKKTYAKHMWMEAKGEKVMIEEFRQLPSDALNVDYLKNRLRSRIDVIYRNCIGVDSSTEDWLRKFDQWLAKNSPKLYEYGTNIQVESKKLNKSWPIVLLWRERKLNACSSYKVYKLYQRIKSLFARRRTTTIAYIDKLN